MLATLAALSPAAGAGGAAGKGGVAGEGGAACGGPDAPCRVPLGTYHVALPDPSGSDAAMPGGAALAAAAAAHPALIHFHGAGGSGAASAGNRAVFGAFLDAGWVVIAPDGLPRQGSDWLGWNLYIPNSGRDRDEVAFTRQVLDDAAARFGLDRGRIVASGYSVGGSAVWNIGCRAPKLFDALLPVSGGFWRPHPAGCAAPVRLLHTHGWQDRTVPLEGRPTRSGRTQGDIFEGLQLWRAANGCESALPDAIAATPAFWRRAWTGCAPGTALGMLLHPGGHEMPSWWAEAALDWLSALPPKAP